METPRTIFVLRDRHRRVEGEPTVRPVPVTVVRETAQRLYIEAEEGHKNQYSYIAKYLDKDADSFYATEEDAWIAQVAKLRQRADDLTASMERVVAEIEATLKHRQGGQPS